MLPIRVLLVDDNPGFLDAAARFLRAASLSVVGLAYSGSHALAQVAELQPDLVLMDVTLFSMNGFDATRAIKAQADPPRVVILTLHDTAEYRAAAQAAGADGFVAKSDFGTQLIPLIQMLFARRTDDPLQ